MTTENENTMTEPRRGSRAALAVTGIVVGSVLLLGMVFGGGVLVGRHLPGPGPGPAFAADEQLERLHERFEDRQERRDDRRDAWRNRGQDAPAPDAPEQD